MDERGGQAAGERFDEPTLEVMPDHHVARLHLVRHAAVQDLGRRLVRGQSDTPLAEHALDQERALAGWMSAIEPRVDRVVASDLARCAGLGERIASSLGLRLELEPRLREQSMGRWEGHTWEEITATDPDLVRAYWSDYAHTRPPGGEALTDLSTRVGQWWTDSLPELLDRRTIVVTHVGVIRVLLARLMRLPLDQTLRLAPAVASHTKVLWSSAGAVLECFGERPWIGRVEAER